MMLAYVMAFVTRNRATLQNFLTICRFLGPDFGWRATGVPDPHPPHSRYVTFLGAVTELQRGSTAIVVHIQHIRISVWEENKYNNIL